jgi:hypothetical protein
MSRTGVNSKLLGASLALNSAHFGGPFSFLENHYAASRYD